MGCGLQGAPFDDGCTTVVQAERRPEPARHTPSVATSWRHLPRFAEKALRGALPMTDARSPVTLRLAAGLGLVFLHLPLAFIILYAFTTEDRSYQFPPPGLTAKWFAVAW